MSLKQALKKTARSTARTFGFDLVAADHLTQGSSRRAKMMNYNDIRTVIDVGANRGDYAGELRESGFQGRIISFEPVASAFQLTSARAAADPSWEAFNFAVGATPGTLEINVASHTAGSSSLLPMLQTHQDNAPDIHYVGKQKIEVVTLDNALAGKLDTAGPLLLKVDTQGYEAQVLRGASTILPHVRLIECELSFVPLYEGQPTFKQMMELIDSLGFEPVNFEPGFVAADSGYCLQLDGLFARKQA